MADWVGLAGVDDRVDLRSAGKVEGRAALVELRDHQLEEMVALDGIGDRLHLRAESQSNRTLESRAAEFAGGPRNSKVLGVNAAAGHGLGA